MTNFKQLNSVSAYGGIEKGDYFLKQDADAGDLGIPILAYLNTMKGITYVINFWFLAR